MGWNAEWNADAGWYLLIQDRLEDTEGAADDGIGYYY